MEFTTRELELLVQSVHSEAHTATDAGDIARLMQLSILLERLRKEHTKQDKIDEREHEIMHAQLNKAADLHIEALIEAVQVRKGRATSEVTMPAALNRPHDKFWWDLIHNKDIPKTRVHGTPKFDDPNDPIFGWNDNPDNKDIPSEIPGIDGKLSGFLENPPQEDK